jgi:tetratricopeptide (TPR) repeat protein
MTSTNKMTVYLPLWHKLLQFFLPIFVGKPAAIAFRLLCSGLVGWTMMAQAISQEADKLYPKSGATQTGKIVDMTRDSVVMEIRDNKQNFPSSDILRIVYEGEPPQFSRAKEQAATDQWDQALESLKRIDTKSIERPEIKNELLFYQGLVLGQLALQGQGDAAAAKARLLEFARANPKSFHFYQLSEMLGLLAVSLGANEEAAKYFGAMSSSPVAETMLQGRYLMGSALLTQGKPAEAKKAFSDAIAASADSVAAKKYQKLSKVAINRCDILDGKTAAAIENLRKMVEEGDATDSQLFSAIYNALGLAHQKEGKNQEAVLDFLHTDLLFQSETDMHAEALYYLSQLFATIGEPQRAADAKSRLQSLYSNSTWAKK